MKLPVPAVQAVKTSVGLLVDGEYDTFWHLTGKVGRPEDVQRAVVQYGRTLVFPPDTEWADIPNVHEGVADGKQVYDVDYPLWTIEEGQSDLELSLTLTEVMEGIYDVRYRDLRGAMTDPWRNPEITAALARLEEAEVGLDQAIVAAKQVEQQTPRTQLSEEDIRMIEEHARGQEAPRQLRELQERIDEGDLSWSDIAAGQHLDDPRVKAALSTGVEGMRQAYTLIEEGQHIDDVIAASAQRPIEPDAPRQDDDGEDGDGPVFRGVY